MPNPHSHIIFNRAHLRQHQDRAAATFPAHSVLFDENTDMLMERLGDVKGSFTSILDLSARNGALTRQLAKRYNAFILAADLSPLMLKLNQYPAVVLDEECIPFATNSFDLVVSNLGLHWVNDLPGTLAQIKSALKSNGLFLASMLGGQTLHELRTCLLEAELGLTGGASPRVSPSIDLQTATALMQRAGFSLPVADQETIVMTYPDVFALMRDLRGMGLANSNQQRLRSFSRRALFDETARLYKTKYSLENGRIPATFDLIFLHGWR